MGEERVIKNNVKLTEKYRPAELDDIMGNNEVIKCLKSLKLTDLPNMLFYGPPGTGKTTAIRALLKSHDRSCIMEMNASDDRGIDTVRERIKEFAQSYSRNLKVVILDEADSMSRDAQGALRRIMEDYENTRFCLICNYSRKIIEPIASRCTKFRFSPVNEESRIREVCMREGIRCSDDGIKMLNDYSDGDMRKIMNDIEGMKASYSEINRENVAEFLGVREDGVFLGILNSLNRGNYEESTVEIQKGGVDVLGLIRWLTGTVKNKDIIKEMARIEGRLLRGCRDDVQMNALIGAFIIYK